MDEELFHRLAEEVEHDYGMGGLSGGLYEDYAHDILARYLAAQHSVHTDPPSACPACGTLPEEAEHDPTCPLATAGG